MLQHQLLLPLSSSPKPVPHERMACSCRGGVRRRHAVALQRVAGHRCHTCSHLQHRAEQYAGRGARVRDHRQDTRRPDVEADSRAKRQGPKSLHRLLPELPCTLCSTPAQREDHDRTSVLNLAPLLPLTPAWCCCARSAAVRKRPQSHFPVRMRAPRRSGLLMPATMLGRPHCQAAAAAGHAHPRRWRRMSARLAPPPTPVGEEEAPEGERQHK